MKKNKKIPYTPKYGFGGMNSDTKKNIKDFAGNYGKLLLDNSANAIGIDAVGAGKGMNYTGKSADKFNKYSNVTGAISKSIAPMAMNAVIPGSGQIVSMGQQVAGGAYGQFGPQNEQGFNAYDNEGNPIVNQNDRSAQFGQMAGQIGGMAGGMMGGGSGGMGAGFMSNLPSGTPPLAMKYGGQMKYAMGGMKPNAEVEGGGYGKDGENTLNPDNTATQFNGPTHEQGGIQTNLDPGTLIFSNKIKWDGKTAADHNKPYAKIIQKANKNLENSNLSKESKLSSHLNLMGATKVSQAIFAQMEALKQAKVQAYAKKMGVQLPSMDNEQMEPQGMSEQSEGEMPMAKHGGMFAMGGVQLPYYNTDNAGNPIYAMGGGYPAMTNPYNNFRGSIPMYDDGGNMPEDPNNVLTGPINFNTNPELISNAANVGGYNAFYKFLNNQKINNEPVLNNKELNTTEGRKKYTEKFINDFNNSDYIKKFPNNKITQDQIKMQQAYHKLSDENVLVDGWVGSQTSRMNYPIQHHVFTRKSNDINSPDYNTPKDSSFVNVSYGNKNYVIPAKSYKYNSVDNIKNMQYSPTDTTLYKPRVVNAGEFKYGGQMQMPKFFDGGPYIDPSETGMQEQADMNAYYNSLNRKNNNFVNSNTHVGNIPTNFNFERSGAFNKEQNQRNLAFNQMTGNKNPGYSNPNVPTVEDTGEGVIVPGVPVPQYETDYTNALGPDWYSKEETRKRENESMARIPDSSFTQMNPNSKNFNWGKLAMQGANFLGQNAGNIYDLTRKNEPLETYDLMTAKYLDPTKAIANENYIYRQTKDAAPGLTGGNAGATLAALGANKAGTATRIGRLRETYDNVNAQIGNQVNQYNTGIKKDQAVARAANAAALENVRSQAVHSIGSNFGKMTKSGKQDNMDQDTLKMFQWRYQNEPGFRKYIDNFSTQNNSEEGTA